MRFKRRKPGSSGRSVHVTAVGYLADRGVESAQQDSAMHEVLCRLLLMVKSDSPGVVATVIQKFVWVADGDKNLVSEWNSFVATSGGAVKLSSASCTHCHGTGNEYELLWRRTPCRTCRGSGHQRINVPIVGWEWTLNNHVLSNVTSLTVNDVIGLRLASVSLNSTDGIRKMARRGASLADRGRQLTAWSIVVAVAIGLAVWAMLL